MTTRSWMPGALGLAAGVMMTACDDPARPREATDAPVSAAIQSSGNSAPVHYRTNGPYAQLFSSVMEGTTLREVYLNLYGLDKDQVLLSYVVWECDVTTWSCEPAEEGYGPIPGDDVTGGHGVLSLNTNTAANPEFTVYVGAGGPVSLTWTELSGWSSRSTNHSRYRSETQLFQSRGKYTSTGAAVAGSIMGHEVMLGNGYGSMGTVSEGGISISRE